MMRCDRVQLLLSDYIDGELSSAGVLGVQAHLRHCSGCESEHQAIRRTVQLVALYGRQEAPIDCRDAVMARLCETPAPSRPLPWLSLDSLLRLQVPTMVPNWARTAAIAGLAAVSLTAGTYLMNREERSTSPNARMQLVQDDHARLREASQLLQVMGHDDGYILAADFVDWSP